MGRDVSGEFSRSFHRGIDEGFKGISSNFGAMGRVAEGAFSKITSSGGIAALGVAGIGVAAFEVGKKLYDLGEQWHQITVEMAVRTGKLGDDLKTLTDDVKKTAVETAAPIADIGDVASRVAQSLHLTGEPLQVMTKTIADLNEMTGEKLNIRDLSKAFRLFGVDVKDGGVDALNSLENASQNTGIPLGELITTMTSKGAVAAKDFGLSFGQAASLITTFEQAGLPLNESINGLAIALKNVPTQEGIAGRVTEIKRLIDIGDSDGAKTLASKTFGRGFVDFLDAIKSGAVDVQSLNGALSNTGPTIDKMRQSTETAHGEFQKLTNQLSVELQPVSDRVFTGINDNLKDVILRIGQIKELWHGLFDPVGMLSQLPGSAPGVPAVPGITGAPGSTPPGGPRPGQNPLDIFAPGGPGHPGPSQTGQGGNSFGVGGGGGAAPAGLTGNKGVVYQAMLNAGYGPEQWPALDQLMMHESGYSPTAHNPSGAYGMFQFMPYTWGPYGAPTSDPATQALYGMEYIKNRYGTPSAAWAQYFNHKNGEGSYAMGGGVDTVPAMLTPGEHVLTIDDVNALGGQPGVYAFRNALHRNGGGDIFKMAEIMGSGSKSPGSWHEGPLSQDQGGHGWQFGTHGWFGGPNINMFIPGGHSLPTKKFQPNDRGRIKLFGSGGMVGIEDNSGGSGPRATWKDVMAIPGLSKAERNQLWDDLGHKGSWGTGFDGGGLVPGMPTIPINPNQMAQSFLTGMQQGGGWGGMISSFIQQGMELQQRQQGGSGQFGASGMPGAPGVPPGSPASGMGGGPAPGPPPVQGRSQAAGMPTGAIGGGGGGGVIGAAAGMFPGGGVAAQLATRAAQFGGQALAIGGEGILETFLPHGSALGDPSRSWLGRGLHGVSGARQAQDNSAGQAEIPMQPPAPPVSSGQGAGPAPGPAIGEVHFGSQVQDPQSMLRDIDRLYESKINAHGAGMGH
jgi:hypothetical protein